MKIRRLMKSTRIVFTICLLVVVLGGCGNKGTKERLKTGEEIAVEQKEKAEEAVDAVNEQVNQLNQQASQLDEE